jgi:hypothetical protein
MGKVSVHRDYKLAAYFVLIAVAVGIVKLVVNYSGQSLSNFNDTLGLGLNALTLALLLWLGIGISKGKNWARITYVVAAASILVFIPLFLLNEFSAGLLTGSLTTVFMLCLLIAVFLLYTKGARAWASEES